MPLEAEFWNPNTVLPSRMRDAITLCEQELARRNGHAMTLGSSRFVRMIERDSESVYDLLSVTPRNTNSKSDSVGSCHPMRECNMFHLCEDGAVATEGMKDDAYPIPRTPRE